jgi:uncharacterized protein
MRTVQRTAPAPEGFGVALIGVPPGGGIELDLRLESVMEGVLVSGTATAPLTGECGRCLEAVEDEIVVDVQELFVYDGSDADEDGNARMEGDLLDLEPALRDAVVLALPLTPLCTPECRGLCAECGERLDDLPDDHAHGAPDPRWAALQDLLDSSTAPSGTDTTAPSGTDTTAPSGTGTTAPPQTGTTEIQE